MPEQKTIKRARRGAREGKSASTQAASKRGLRKVRQAKRKLQRAVGRQYTVSRRRSRATLGALKHEGRGAASTRAISRRIRSTVRRRGSAAARKVTRIKGAMKRIAATRRGTHSSLSPRIRNLARSWRIHHNH